MLGARDHHVIYREALPFLDRIRYVLAIGLTF
jgi:hypothetical protein